MQAKVAGLCTLVAENCWYFKSCVCCRYQSPSQREEAFAESLRQQKQQAAAQAAALVQQYGPDGAAAMQHILAMKRPNRKYICITASREDLAAVQQLPAAGLPEA
jgi:hypothetical protein